jgi:predicted DNA-binding protein (UPF0251 family)
MSDYQRAQQFLDVLSRLDGDYPIDGDYPKLPLLFPRWEFVFRLDAFSRSTCRLKRHVHRPNERVEKLEDETVAMARDIAKELDEEGRDATIRFLKGQGVDTKDFLHWTKKLTQDLLDIIKRQLCAYRSRPQLAGMQILLENALITGKPADLSAGSPPPTNKPRRKRRRAGEPKLVPLTDRESEAVQMVGEHKGNFTAAARAMGLSRQRVSELYRAGNKKLGKAAVQKPKTQSLPQDRRGQIDL